MEAWLSEVLKAYGLAGAVIGVQGYAIMKLYNRNQELHDTLLKTGVAAVEANNATANAINRLSDLMGLRSQKAA